MCWNTDSHLQSLVGRRLSSFCEVISVLSTAVLRLTSCFLTKNKGFILFHCIYYICIFIQLGGVFSSTSPAPLLTPTLKIKVRSSQSVDLVCRAPKGNRGVLFKLFQEREEVYKLEYVCMFSKNVFWLFWGFVLWRWTGWTYSMELRKFISQSGWIPKNLISSAVCTWTSRDSTVRWVPTWI